MSQYCPLENTDLISYCKLNEYEIQAKPAQCPHSTECAEYLNATVSSYEDQ